jgi:hypothetical protein
MDNEIDEVEEIKDPVDPEIKAEPKEVSDFASFMREGVTIVRHKENTFELERAGWVKL